MFLHIKTLLRPAEYSIAYLAAKSNRQNKILCKFVTFTQLQSKYCGTKKRWHNDEKGGECSA